MFDFFKKKKVDIVEVTQEKIVTDYADVSKIAEYFKNETGVTFDKQVSILKNKVTTFCKHRDIYSFKSLLSLVQSDEQTKQELVDYLTTNETFFYREFKQVAQLVELVKGTSGKVDILCAPSATGEEPYSIVIALLEANVSPVRFKVLGIDINQEALQRATIATYRQRNVRNLSQEVLDKYFEKSDDAFNLKESVKSCVSFKLINLFDDSFKNIGKFDFIFSRNMLIYFDKETKLQAKNILEKQRKDETQEIFFGHADLF